MGDWFVFWDGNARMQRWCGGCYGIEKNYSCVGLPSSSRFGRETPPFREESFFVLGKYYS
jgi:hypothetical protein